MTTPTETSNVNRLDSWANHIEKKLTDFANWTIENSGVTRIVSKEQLVTSNETASKIKKIVGSIVIGSVLLVPALIGFSAHQIKEDLSRAWTYLVGKKSSTAAEPATSETAANVSDQEGSKTEGTTDTAAAETAPQTTPANDTTLAVADPLPDTGDTEALAPVENVPSPTAPTTAAAEANTDNS